jgi:hypothetical protein
LIISKFEEEQWIAKDNKDTGNTTQQDTHQVPHSETKPKELKEYTS